MDRQMPHYNTLAEERVAIENFQMLTETQLKPEIRNLMSATSKSEFERRIGDMRDGNVMSEWRAMFDSFRDPHDPANQNAAADIAQEVNALLRRALAHKGTLRAGGFRMPRKYSRKYCKKTPCKKMGFTQRSSCRPYKNCFTRRRGRTA